MLAHEEKQYLAWLTANQFEGWGSIVDLGPWLGSSSAALAEGLSRRRAHTRIFSFDLFRWERSYMQAFATTNLNDGDDFLPVFMREVGDYAAWIEPRKVDLMGYSWNGGPIEILFIDAAKSWDLANAIFRGFGNHLVPGRSRIVLQDFRYPHTHWLPLIFDSRPDLWKQVEDVDEGHLVTFVPLKPLSGPAGIQADYSEEAFPIESAEHLLRSRIERETPSNRHWLVKSLCRKFLIDGPLEEAEKIRAELVAGGMSSHELASLGDVEAILVPRGWRAYDRGAFETSCAIAERCLRISEKRSVYVLTLLAFSLLRLGDAKAASSSIDEVLAEMPNFASARLLRAELESAKGQYQQAQAEALDVLRASPGDESTIQYSLSVLSQVWNVHGNRESHAKDLERLAPSFRESPSFLATLAREQFKAGRKREALQNLKKALNLAPDHKLAREVRAGWGRFGRR